MNFSEKLRDRENSVDREIKYALEIAGKNMPKGMELVVSGQKIFIKRKVEIGNIDELNWLGLSIVPVGNMIIEFVGESYEEITMEQTQEYMLSKNIKIKNMNDIKEFPIEMEVVVEDELDYEMLSYCTGKDGLNVGNVTLKWIKRN